MTHAYDEIYLSGAQAVLGGMLDYAVQDVGLSAEGYWSMFLKSDISGKFAAGDVKYLAGKSGVELAMEVLEENHPGRAEVPAKAHMSRSPYYWAGWALAAYQWSSGASFTQIDYVIRMNDILNMYEKYHEMDLGHFVDEMDRICREKRMETYLKLYRRKLGKTQKELADEVGISVRTLQQYEQRQKNINNASALTVIRIAKALGVRPEVLLEPTGKETSNG